MSNLQPDNTVQLGKILKPHGIRGEVKVLLFNSSSDTLQKKMIVRVSDTRGMGRDLSVENIKYMPSALVIKFSEISSPESAEELRGCLISVSREMLPPVDEDEFYLMDLVGFRVLDETGTLLGTVKNVYDYPANDLIEIDYNGKDVLIPLVDEFIRLIEFDEKYLMIQVPEGLLDL